MTAPKPQSSILAYGIPCERCAHPAYQVHIFPDRRVITHTNLRLPRCTLPPMEVSHEVRAR